MEAWFMEKLAETSLGGYSLLLVCVWWLSQNVFKIISSWNDGRKLSLADKQANREGFTAQVESLQDEVGGLREENRLLRNEYDQHRKQCQIETDQLRSDLVLVNQRLSGTLRKVADIAIRVARGDVDPGVVQSILELAKEADQISHGRDGTL